LVAFHRALAEQSIEGYLHSLSFRLESLPWVPAARPLYEDWYGLENSCALDAINRAAVTALAQRPHDALASEAAFGTAGLYRSRAGPGSLGHRFAYWFAKPDGMTYADLDSDAAPAVASGATLWQRQMVLGPGHEFCLLSPDLVTLPAPLVVLGVERHPLD
jgi:hypothetical protein